MQALMVKLDLLYGCTCLCICPPTHPVAMDWCTECLPPLLDAHRHPQIQCGGEERSTCAPEENDGAAMPVERMNVHFSHLAKHTAARAAVANQNLK